MMKLTLRAFLLVLSAALLFSACGGGNNASDDPGSDTGTLNFQVAYQGATNSQPQVAQPHDATIDCSGEGIEKIEASVYNSAGILRANGGPWDCEDGEGTISSVPAGSGFIIIIMGKNSDEDVVFRGEKPDITVAAKRDNNVGTINCTTFVPGLLAPANGAEVDANAMGLTWTAITGARYRVKVSEDSNLDNPIINTVATATNYTPTSLSDGTTYYWQVIAEDLYDNIGFGSPVWSFTVNASHANMVPVAQITSPAEGSTFIAGNSIMFSGSGTDTEDGDLSGTSLAWSSDIDGPIGTGASFSSDALNAGSHTITLTASDSEGATGTATISITVNAAPVNNSPVAAISSPTDGGTFNDDVSISFSGSGTDAEDSTLSGQALRWSSNINGEIGIGASFSTDTLSIGTHTITLTVTDSQDATGTATITITVNAAPVNTPPVATITSPADGSTFYDDVSISFSGSGTDAEDGDPLLSWSSNIDGGFGTGGSVSTDTLSIGTHTITLTATDSNDATGTATISITVNAAPVNTPPVATITSPADGTTFTDLDTIQFSGTGTDSEDSDLTGQSLQWTSDIDGSIGEGESFSTDTLSGGTHLITLTARDSDDATGTDTVSITVNVGSPPAPPKLSIIVSGTQNKLSWNEITDATAYNIYWSSTETVTKTDFEGVFTITGRTDFTHTLLTHGKAYYYVITAENIYGEGDISRKVVGVAGMKFDVYPTIAQDRGYGIAVAKDGNTYLSGESCAGVQPAPQVNFIRKERPNGYVLWDETMSVLSSTYCTDGGNGIALDDRASDQYLYFTGRTFENIDVSGRDIIIRKYDSAGTVAWTRYIETSASDHAYDIAVYSNNLGLQYHAYITGFVSGAVGSDPHQGSTDILLAKYDEDGTRLWARTMGTSSWDVAYAVATDQYGQAYITGRTWGDLNNEGTGIFVAKYNFAGTFQWSKIVDATGANTGYGNAITVDQYSNVYISGYVGSTSARNIILAKYDKDGNELWTEILDETSSVNSMGVALDEQESVYIVGYGYGTVESQQNQGGADVLVAKFDPYGNKQWLRMFGGTGTDVGRRIVVKNGVCYIAGYSSASINGSGHLEIQGTNAWKFTLPME